MAIYKVKVFDKEGVFDAVGQGVVRDIRDLGIESVKQARFAFLYYLSGDIDEKTIRRVAEELLIDKITQEYSIESSHRQMAGCRHGRQEPKAESRKLIEVAYNSGVMDPVEESFLKAVSDMGIAGLNSARTARQYILEGSLSDKELKIISDKLLCNKVIQHVVLSETSPPWQSETGQGNQSTETRNIDYKFKLITVDLLKASDKKLCQISRQGQLFLNLAEMRQIRDYFKKLGRKPTDVELETIAQTWSEHCRHKTFRGKIEYREENQISKIKYQKYKPKFKTKIIDNLLKSTIMKVTKELNKPWCVSVFEDNSGVIRFDDEYNICFKVETHNHPSALEPFGGANTGIGGVIRDPMGTGLGAKPIFNTDVFCFGPPDYPQNKLPQGVLHPKRVAKGVVSGVRDYGNKMGIPTINGAVLFDPGYIANPLVYCGTAGILPKDKSFKKFQKET